MMETALGVLEWSPDEFWNATYMDFTSAINGRVKMNQRRSSTVEPMTREEFDELNEAYGAPSHSLTRVAPGTKRVSAKRRKRERLDHGDHD